MFTGAIQNSQVFDIQPNRCLNCKFGRNLEGDTRNACPHIFTPWGYNMPCPTTFFFSGFVFGGISKTKVNFVTFCVNNFSC